jgi:hypothetical protein
LRELLVGELAGGGLCAASHVEAPLVESVVSSP